MAASDWKVAMSATRFYDHRVPALEFARARTAVEKKREEKWREEGYDFDDEDLDDDEPDDDEPDDEPDHEAAEKGS